MIIRYDHDIIIHDRLLCDNESITYDHQHDHDIIIHDRLL
jgi:hypothetical protein